MNEIDDTIQIANDARAEFNLMARLQERPTRTKDVEVFTDEVLGVKHAELTRDLATAKLTGADPEDYAQIEAELRTVAREVHESGFTVSLRAVPKVVIKKADRDTRKALGIKGTPHPDLVEEFGEQYTARVLRDSIEKVTDHKSKAVQREFTVDEVRALKDYLPTGQFEKIDEALSDLSLTAQISDAVTADADF